MRKNQTAGFEKAEKTKASESIAEEIVNHKDLKIKEKELKTIFEEQNEEEKITKKRDKAAESVAERFKYCLQPYPQ